MTHVRNSEQFQDNLVVQKKFGDICLAYQLHIRSESYMKMQQQTENFEEEREQYKKQVREDLEDETRKKKQEVDALMEELRKAEECE